MDLVDGRTSVAFELVDLQGVDVLGSRQPRAHLQVRAGKRAEAEMWWLGVHGDVNLEVSDHIALLHQHRGSGT